MVFRITFFEYAFNFKALIIAESAPPPSLSCYVIHLQNFTALNHAPKNVNQYIKDHASIYSQIYFVWHLGLFG